MFIPGLSVETSWNTFLRILCYGLFLAYCFVGVAIIADKFMVAIEVITAKQKTVHLKNEMGDLEGALAAYEKAISLDRNQFMAHTNKGAVLCEQEKYQEALKEYDKAISINQKRFAS